MRYLPFFLLLLACQTPNTSTQFDAQAQQKVVHEVEDMLHAYHAAIEQDGLEAEFAFLDTSEQFFWVPPGYESALDFDSVQTILLHNAKNMQQIHFEWESLTINALSLEFATYHGIVAGNMQDTSGTEFPVKILESGALIKRPSGWKLLSGQSVNLTR